MGSLGSLQVGQLYGKLHMLALVALGIKVLHELNSSKHCSCLHGKSLLLQISEHYFLQPIVAGAKCRTGNKILTSTLCVQQNLL